MSTPSPAIINTESLANWLNMPMVHLTICLRSRNKQYQRTRIPKRTGGYRDIWDPSGIMRQIQRRLRSVLFTPMVRALGDHVAAYREGMSTLDAAKQHAGRATRVKLDLKDFFPGTGRAVIRSYLKDAFGVDDVVANAITSLLTVNWEAPTGAVRDGKAVTRKREGVPQGSLTAGDICNLVADRRLDGPLLGALRKLDAAWGVELRYTRYSDDLYISSDKVLTSAQVGELLAVVRQRAIAAGWRINEKKTQVHRAGRQNRFLGFEIGEKVNIPRSIYEKLHGDIYHAKKHGWDYVIARNSELKDAAHAVKVYEGRLAYYAPVAPVKVAKLRKLLLATLTS